MDYVFEGKNNNNEIDVKDVVISEPAEAVITRAHGPYQLKSLNSHVIFFISQANGFVAKPHPKLNRDTNA